jgi:muconolactone delta-isomerase
MTQASFQSLFYTVGMVQSDMSGHVQKHGAIRHVWTRPKAWCNQTCLDTSKSMVQSDMSGHVKKHGANRHVWTRPKHGAI